MQDNSVQHLIYNKISISNLVQTAQIYKSMVKIFLVNQTRNHKKTVINILMDNETKTLNVHITCWITTSKEETGISLHSS